MTETYDDPQKIAEANAWCEQHPDVAITVKDLEPITDGIVTAIMMRLKREFTRVDQRIKALEELATKDGAGLAARLKDGHAQR
jgi:hypothetical protein